MFRSQSLGSLGDVRIITDPDNDPVKDRVRLALIPSVSLQIQFRSEKDTHTVDIRGKWEKELLIAFFKAGIEILGGLNG